jgi:hypothetical protein
MELATAPVLEPLAQLAWQGWAWTLELQASTTWGESPPALARSVQAPWLALMGLPRKFARHSRALMLGLRF